MKVLSYLKSFHLFRTVFVGTQESFKKHHPFVEMMCADYYI